MNVAAAACIDVQWLETLETLETEAAALSMENADRHREHRGERKVLVDPDELLTLIRFAKAGMRIQQVKR